MLTRVDELKLRIASLKRQIQKNDNDMEAADDRQSMRRRHGDDLFRQLLNAENELERESAPLVKREPKGVKAGCYDV